MINQVIYGAGKRHQIVKVTGSYWLLDTQNNHVKASMSENGWTIDCQRVFERFCDKWNDGTYRDNE